MRFNLSAENVMLPEGEYLFKISNIETKIEEDFGNITLIITFTTNEGQNHREYYYLMKGNVVNEITQRVLTRLYNAAMGTNYFEVEVDFDDMLNKYVYATVAHREYEKNGETRTASNLKDYKSALSSASQVNQPIAQPQQSQSVSLKDLFG